MRVPCSVSARRSICATIPNSSVVIANATIRCIRGLRSVKESVQ